MKKFWLIIFFILFFAGLLAWHSFQQGQDSFRLRDVQLEITAPEAVSAGEETAFLVKYSNKTKVALKQAELIFEDNHNQTLGDLEPGQEGEIEIKKKILGQKDEIKTLRVKLRFQPTNFRSFFETEAQAEMQIKSSSIIASLEGPKQALNGELVEYTLNYANKSESVFENLEVVFNFPDGFNSQDIWKIDKLEPNKMGNIKVKGALIGKDNEEKTTTAKISEIAVLSITTKIIGSSLLLEQKKTENGYIINYTNNSELALNQAEITIYLESEAFDFETIEIEKGSFDKFSKKITWNSAGVPELEVLEPHEIGQVDFKIKLKDPLPLANNFVLKTIAEIKSQDIQNAQELIINLDSHVVLQTKAYYASGYLPLKVNQLTYYDIHWQVLNGANDISETVITASLPLAVEWQGVVSNEHGRLYYDQESNEAVWDLGLAPAWVGRNQAVYEAVFRIGVRPLSNQVNKTIAVLNETVLIAKDIFTENTLSKRQNYIPSDLPDDPNISYDQGVVQP